MTDLAPAPAAFDVEPLELGAAAAAALLALHGLQPALADADGIALPPDEPTIVWSDLGADVRAVLVVSKAAVRQLQVGPPPADDLVDACAEPLAAIGATIGMIPQGPPAIGERRLARANKGEGAVGVLLLDDAGTHVCTVVLAGPVPEDDLAGQLPGAEPAPVHEFAPVPESASALAHTGLELLHDVSLGVTAELGRTQMLVKDVLSLAPGSVIELDRAAGSPVDVLVNGTLIARGEVVVIDEEFGIRITEVIGYVDGQSR
jgi:flagellar motor switch protein FliN/FliY